MSNYCNSRIGFICDEAKTGELKKLYDVFYTLYEKYRYGDYIPFDEILLVYGLDSNIAPYGGEICYVGDYNDGDRYFRISTNTAWKPTPELWDNVIKQYTGIRCVYVAEENSGDIYINTDSERICFPERYVI